MSRWSYVLLLGLTGGYSWLGCLVLTGDFFSCPACYSLALHASSMLVLQASAWPSYVQCDRLPLGLENHLLVLNATPCR